MAQKIRAVDERVNGSFSLVHAAAGKPTGFSAPRPEAANYMDAFLVLRLALRRAFFFVPFEPFLRPFFAPFLAPFFFAARLFLATVTPP
jgi:hypothetical protein